MKYFPVIYGFFFPVHSNRKDTSVSHNAIVLFIFNLTFPIELVTSSDQNRFFLYLERANGSPRNLGLVTNMLKFFPSYPILCMDSDLQMNKKYKSDAVIHDSWLNNLKCNSTCSFSTFFSHLVLFVLMLYFIFIFHFERI